MVPASFGNCCYEEAFWSGPSVNVQSLTGRACLYLLIVLIYPSMLILVAHPAGVYDTDQWSRCQVLTGLRSTEQHSHAGRS